MRGPYWHCAWSANGLMLSWRFRSHCAETRNLKGERTSLCGAGGCDCCVDCQVDNDDGSGWSCWSWRLLALQEGAGRSVSSRI